MDVYVSERQGKVYLLDINPFSVTTDSLLFQWEEILNQPASESPELRVIESQDQVQGASQPAFSTNRLPKEGVDLSNGASIEEFAARFHETLRSMEDENVN
jgi:hypothetical protein